MQRVKVGVVGAGGIAQIEHVPNLLALRDRFDLCGVCDPSLVARSFIHERFGLPVFETVEQLLHLPLDAVVIASPDALHKEQVLAALGRGLHVFCEKPLCYGVADIAELIDARDRAGRVLQVGTMKRFDPSYEAALAHLPGTAKTLRQVSVEVIDPDAAPFIRHHAWQRSDDVPPELIAELGAKQAEQVARAVRVPLDPVGYQGFCSAYCSAIVHDVNLVHGLLEALGVPAGEIVGASLFAGGMGGHGAVRLLDGQALWTMTHLTVPGLPDYRERITLNFDDAALELEFPSPWLNHHPTRLTLRRTKADALHVEEFHSGFAEAFVEELKGFWSAIAEGNPVRNTAEHASADMALLAGLARWHATHTPQPIRSGEPL
jgi:predicted dehydrogenase